MATKKGSGRGRTTGKDGENETEKTTTSTTKKVAKKKVAKRNVTKKNLRGEEFIVKEVPSPPKIEPDPSDFGASLLKSKEPQIVLHAADGSMHMVAIQRVLDYINGKGDLPEEVKRALVHHWFSHNKYPEWYDAWMFDSEE